MRTTLDINSELLKQARELTHIESKTALIHEGLRVLIEKKSAERLAALGATEKHLKDIPRRRT